MYNVKRLLLFCLLATPLISLLLSCGEEDKSKRVSPPATATETIASGNTVTINYSRPSLKGRRIGKDIATFNEVWRTGANEATTFEITKDTKIQGQPLMKGKYSLYTIPGKEAWTFIFNKIWDQWGTEYKETDDVLRVQAKLQKAADYFEMLKFIIEKDGTVLLYWGDTMVGFKVE